MQHCNGIYPHTHAVLAPGDSVLVIPQGYPRRIAGIDPNYSAVREMRGVAKSDGTGTPHIGAFLDYVTFTPPSTDGTQCMQSSSYSMNRCLIQCNTDGARINGGEIPQVITECIFYVTAQDTGNYLFLIKYFLLFHETNNSFRRSQR